MNLAQGDDSDKMEEADEFTEQQRALQESYSNNRSQLNIIFDILGTPSDSDLSHLDTRTANVLRRLQPRAGKVSVDKLKNITQVYLIKINDILFISGNQSHLSCY